MQKSYTSQYDSLDFVCPKLNLGKLVYFAKTKRRTCYYEKYKTIVSKYNYILRNHFIIFKTYKLFFVGSQNIEIINYFIEILFNIIVLL